MSLGDHPFSNRKGLAFAALLALAVVVLVAAAVAYIYLRKQPSGASSVPDLEVTYTAAGFTPALLEVPLGSRVTFKNATEASLWVASDPHPGHTDYPEFDAKEESGPGGTFTFKFEKSGTFGYHNERHPSDHASIYVSDPNNPLPQIDKTVPGQRAIRDKLIAMLDAHDPSSIFKVVDAIQADSALALNCHDIAHDIGHQAYEMFGFSGAMAFDNPDHVKHSLVQYICAGGYMHGIVEELFLHQPSFKAKPDPVCAAVPESDRESCFHGVGHALMFIEKRDVQAALGDCRNIQDSKYLYRCFEGVWMELFWGKTGSQTAKELGWDPEKPLDSCLVLQREDEKPTCFLYVTFGYLRIHPKDYSGAVDMCTQDLKGTDAEFCLKGLGLTMMSKFKGQNLEGSEAYVKGLPTQERRAFYEGVMGYAVLSGIRQKNLETSCRAFQADSELCLGVLGDIK